MIVNTFSLLNVVRYSDTFLVYNTFLETLAAVIEFDPINCNKLLCAMKQAAKLIENGWLLKIEIIQTNTKSL